MIALDTNILVHAHRAEMEHHGEAVRLLRDLAEGDEPWALPWPCVYEFLRVVTHPRVFDPPSALDEVLQDLASLLASPSLWLLGNGPDHVRYLWPAVTAGRATGNCCGEKECPAAR